MALAKPPITKGMINTPNTDVHIQTQTSTDVHTQAFTDVYDKISTDVHVHTPRRAVFKGEKRTARMNLLLQPSLVEWFKAFCWSNGYSLNTAAQEAFQMWVVSKGGQPYEGGK